MLSIYDVRELNVFAHNYLVQELVPSRKLIFHVAILLRKLITLHRELSNFSKNFNSKRVFSVFFFILGIYLFFSLLKKWNAFCDYEYFEGNYITFGKHFFVIDKYTY